ncbi:pyruvate kinase alpha/beta domain-containing protein [Microvirga zambiensis]|uniref:pyruvate kinase alpha/beta domain-containing protein n=1 Tax=Microvirga zambiensis TaxID=1402137 RepID=UPI0031B59334
MSGRSGGRTKARSSRPDRRRGNRRMDVHSYEEMVERAAAMALSEEFAQPADQIVVVAGIPFGQAGTTNNLRVVQLGRT